MSASEARTALLTALAAISPSLTTVETNEAFEPTVDQAYQRADVLFAEPDNAEYGANFQDRGFLQVTLCYPLAQGLDDLMTRAELLRTTFARGSSFASGSTTVRIVRTPQILPGQAEDTVFAVPVRIPFHAS